MHRLYTFGILFYNNRPQVVYHVRIRHPFNGLDTSQQITDAHERQQPREIRQGQQPKTESYDFIRYVFNNLTYTSHGKQKGTDIEGRTEAQHSLALSV